MRNLCCSSPDIVSRMHVADAEEVVVVEEDVVDEEEATGSL